MTLPGLYNFGNTSNRIQKAIDELDKKWYLLNLDKFKSQCRDGEDYIEIDETPENWDSLTEEEKSDYNVEFFIRLMDFKEFCYPDYRKIELRIINEVQKIIDNTNPRSDGIKKIIRHVGEVVENAIQENTNSFRNDGYRSLLKALTKNCEWVITYHFQEKIADLELYDSIINMDIPVSIDNLPQGHPAQGNEKNTLAYLDCLRGKWQGIKIMTDEEHEKLVEYTNLVLKSEKLPKNIKQISRHSTIPFEFIRKTFHFMYLENKKVPQTKVWVDFLHSAFEMNETKTTTKNNFPTYRGDYQGTKALIKQ